MKKRLVICASIVAIVLSLGMLTISILAAVKQEFSVSNKITFIGLDEYLVFDLDAKVTGVIDEENYIFEGWEYNLETNPEPSKTWNIGELNFKEKGLDEFVISYDFTILNKSKGNKLLTATIQMPEVDENLLECSVVSDDENMEGVAVNQTLKISLKLKAKVKFYEPTTCNFSVIISSVD